MCAIDNGVYNGNDTFKSGSYKIGDDTIKDWNNTGWGTITYDKGFEYSSNAGIANILNKNLTKNQLRDCFKKYGFGQTTDVELTREQTGNINFNYKIEEIQNKLLNFEGITDCIVISKDNKFLVFLYLFQHIYEYTYIHIY